MNPLIEKLIAKLPKKHKEPFIGHLCQCGNPIYCGHRNQVIDEMKSKLPEMLEVIKGEIEKLKKPISKGWKSW